MPRAFSSPRLSPVDGIEVKGLDKLTNVRLAEVITQKNVISAEVITDALYYQDKYGDPFVQTLVGAGHITEWDLAKLVAEARLMPGLMLCTRLGLVRLPLVLLILVRHCR